MRQPAMSSSPGVEGACRVGRAPRGVTPDPFVAPACSADDARTARASVVALPSSMTRVLLEAHPATFTGLRRGGRRMRRTRDPPTYHQYDGGSRARRKRPRASTADPANVAGYATSVRGRRRAKCAARAERCNSTIGALCDGADAATDQCRRCWLDPLCGSGFRSDSATARTRAQSSPFGGNRRSTPQRFGWPTAPSGPYFRDRRTHFRDCDLSPCKMAASQNLETVPAFGTDFRNGRRWGVPETMNRTIPTGFQADPTWDLSQGIG